MIENLKFHLSSAKKWDPKLFYYQFIKIVPELISIYLGVLLPSKVVEGLENKWSMAGILWMVVGIAVAIWLCDLIYRSMFQYLYRNSMALTMYYDNLCFRKMMRIDYDCLEGKQQQKIIGNAWNSLRNEYVIRDSVTGLSDLGTATLGSLFYGIMIAKVSLLVIVMLVLSVLISFYLLKKVREFHKEQSKKLYGCTKEIAYINRQAMERSAGKDIRIYQMQKWLLSRYHKSVSQQGKIYHLIHRKYFERSVIETLTTYTTEVVSCGYFIFLLYHGRMTVSQFVFYMNLVLVFSQQFAVMVHEIMNLNVINTAMSNIRGLLNLKEQERWGKGIGEERLSSILKDGVKIEFDHVYFSYAQEEGYVLEDICLTINPGEKLALIGLNGAGKTTLVKLLCGFYHPDKGEIRINGIPQSKFKRSEYESLLSVLFQDSSVLPLTLDENLTGEERADREKLEYAMELSGFKEKYHSLSKEGKTLLVREANENATDFSGGEFQKLLFARALYKRAPILILDEPTAALDPIAESQLYEKYGEACKHRTSLYISHRLSSTKFCDRIILLEDARIKEEGSHDELMKKQGSYAKLFAMQSKYYQEKTEEVRGETA